MSVNMKPIFVAAKDFEQATKEAMEKLAASEEILFKALQHLGDEMQRAEQLREEARKIHEAAKARVGEEAKKETLKVYGVKDGHCEDDVRGRICGISREGMCVVVYARKAGKEYQYPSIDIAKEEGWGLLGLEHSNCTAAVYQEMLDRGRKLTGLLTKRRQKRQ